MAVSAVDKRSLENWVPRTRVGRLVKEGKITSLGELFSKNMPLIEPEIVDYLLPELVYERLDATIVQKMTDAGRITRFRVVVIVGNRGGFVGIGFGKARQYNIALQKALRTAKLNIVPVRRGCGSWECICNEPHSIPFTVVGKAGSVRITVKPAPKGTGLVAGEVAKKVLSLAGVSDAWTNTIGETKTTYNFAAATLDALRKTYSIVTPVDWSR